MRSDVRLLLILTVATCGTGCADPRDPLLDEALLRFRLAYSCPANRMTVQHAEMPLADLVEQKPPAEVAADAGRLAVWKQTVDKELARYDRLTAFDVSGCGRHADYLCWYGHRLHRDHECLPVDLDESLPDFTTLALKPSAHQLVRQRLGLPPAPPSPSPAAAAQPNEPPPSGSAIAAEVRAREKAMRERLTREARESGAR